MHRKKFLPLLLALCLLVSVFPVGAEMAGAGLDDVPALFRPGKTERLSFTAAADGEGVLLLADVDGGAPRALGAPQAFQRGANPLFWDGLDAQGEPVAPGEYRLLLRMQQEEFSAPIHVGEVSPGLQAVRVNDASIRPGQEGWLIIAQANMPGLLQLHILLDNQRQQEIMYQQVPQGELHIPWDGTVGGYAVKEGMHTLTLTLTGEDGFVSNAQHVLVQVMAPLVPTQTPLLPELSPQSPSSDSVQAAPEETPLVAQQTPLIAQEPAANALSFEEAHKPQYKIPSLEPIPQSQWGTSYWTTPMGKWDEQQIWQVMMQPITVIVGRDQRETYKLRKEPDASSKRENIVGEITYVSQGVHVLKTLDNGWSLVEANNSSYGPNNRSRRGYGDTDEIIKGYVETKYLETVTPRDDFGILIDKLKQEMYVFREGKLYTTLVISTGKPTRAQPWNETPSGEFLMVSRVGDFPAGNLTCAMGMRINGGSLIHEVPYLTNATTGYRDYGPQERQLGEKASHGCIRVQRKNNDDGINMTWLWNNIKVNTKVLIWDDSPGRFHEYPAGDLALYYNPNNGKFYHADQNCPSIRDRFLPLKGSMTYAELDNAEYLKLTPCTRCTPPKRPAEIDKINQANGF